MIKITNLNELVRVPLSLDKGRLNVKPSKMNHLYVIEDRLFHYELRPVVPELRDFPQFHKVDEGRCLANCGEATHYFLNRSGDLQDFKFWAIGLSDQIPEKFRDIFFYHEVKESLHIATGLPQPQAHELARAADLAYRQNYLIVEEQQEFIRAEQLLLGLN